MIVDSDYRGYRIEVVAFQSEGGWDAEVRIRRTPFTRTTCAGHLTCRKPTAQVAEQSGAACARQWVDRYERPGSAESSADRDAGRPRLSRPRFEKRSVSAVETTHYEGR